MAGPFQPRLPGQRVLIDTLEVRPLPGVMLKHFSTRDMISRWDVLEVHSVATSNLAAKFLTTLRQQAPFPIRAAQVDGGSDFSGQLERACQSQKIRQFVLPPKSPKLNGHVERVKRTHTEEFWELYDLPWTSKELGIFPEAFSSSAVLSHLS